MSDEHVLSEALAILGDLTGGQPLAFDENGLCGLTHQDGFVVTLMTAPESDILLLSAQLVEVPDDGREAFFAWLLRLNFLGLDTGGAALSVDEEERHVYLSHSVPLARVDAQALVTVVGNFIEVAAGLRTRILAERASGVSRDSSPVEGGRSQPPGWIMG